ncbi:hypothetical protein IKQ21_03820, partial [bacterium]|nr:hypothetical protein [bacterium]
MEKNLKKGCQICQNHNGYDISGRIMNFGSINVENNSDSVGVLREPDIQTGAVKTVTSETKPLLPEYYEIGDKYLDLILENPVNTQVLVNLSALQDIYEAGEGIDIQNRIITNTKTTTWGEIAGTLLDQTDLTNALALKCNADLSNMPNSFWQKLHVILALKTGEISADSELLVWIEDMYYSTFDKSKFTIVGSPNITDDGVASGFSDSNKISIQNPFNNFNKIVFNIKFEANKTGVLLSGFTQTPSTFNPMYIYKSSETTVNFVWRNSSASNVINEQFTGINANATKYKFVLDTNSNILTLYVDDVFYDSKSVTTTNLMKDFNTFYIGSTDGTSNFTGSIDLKGVGVNADGVPVFSGNKTGVDTIKPDDYTPEGSIASTITADGIASGFSESNYLTLPYQYSDNVINYVEKITFTTASDVTTRQPIRGINENANKGIGITINSGKMNYRIGTGTSWQQSDSTVSVSTNTTYTVEFTQTSTTTTFKLYSENGTLLDTTSVNHVNLLYAEIVLGTNKIWSNEYFRGSIDLKEYKIYLDGQLVYIPYLQIPYTESKTGSKIVDSAYRELVNY